VNRHGSVVTILTSGIGLGVYIPALLIQRQLRRLHCEAEVEVLEDYYTPERQQGHLNHKRAHHENFALAQIAHRMTRDVQECLDAERIQALIQRWAEERRENFVVWSGFWLPIVERYRQLIGSRHLNVDHCRIDAEISASFRIFPGLQANANVIWLWNGEDQRIIHEISVTGTAPVPFAGRENRLVLHGGGWGIGTYNSKALELEHTPYSLDIVIQDLSEARQGRPGDRYFMVDPAWHPWIRNAEGGHDFPPTGEVTDPRDINYKRNPDFHELHNVIRRSKAIVSKPGGCTLIDSLSSGTPVVFLEPYGYAEKSNAKIWEHLGYGISWPAWRETGYDVSVLENLHSNIMARARRGTDYPRAYVERLS
jgi:hypothetical protein